MYYLLLDENCAHNGQECSIGENFKTTGFFDVRSTNALFSQMDVSISKIACVSFNYTEIVEPTEYGWHVSLLSIDYIEDLFNIDTFKTLISEGMDVHQNGDEVLTNACASGNLELVQFLVEECNCYIHQRDEAALAKAMLKGHKDVEDYLVSKGAYKDIALNHIRAEATFDFQTEEAQYVLNHRDAFELSHSEDSAKCYVNALRAACRLNDLDYAKALVGKGADVKIDGTVAFIDACKYGNLQFVKYLIEQGVYVHMNSGLALHEAQSHNHPQIVAILEGLSVRDCTVYSDQMNTDWWTSDVQEPPIDSATIMDYRVFYALGSCFRNDVSYTRIVPYLPHIKLDDNELFNEVVQILERISNEEKTIKERVQTILEELDYPDLDYSDLSPYLPTAELDDSALQRAIETVLKTLGY